MATNMDVLVLEDFVLLKEEQPAAKNIPWTPTSRSSPWTSPFPKARSPIIALIHVDHHPSRASLAVFGLCWLVFFGFWGRLVAWRHPLWMPAAYGLWGAPGRAVARPSQREFMRILYVAMSYLAYPIGMVVSFLLLATLYFGVFTPIGLVLRLLGHDPMQRRFDCVALSYWMARRQDNDKSRYFKQF